MKSYIKEINQLIAEENETDAITLLENYCDNNPNDNEAKFDLALLLSQQFIYVDGFFDSLKILDDLLIKDPVNIKSIILKAHIEHTQMGQIDNTTKKLIDLYISTKANYDFFEKQLWVLKALYYQDNNNELFINSLRESIEYDNEASFNYYLMAKECILKKEYLTAKTYIEQSKKNILKVYSQKDLKDFDVFDFEEYVNEHLRGVYITEPNFETIVSDYDSCINN